MFEAGRKKFSMIYELIWNADELKKHRKAEAKAERRRRRAEVKAEKRRKAEEEQYSRKGDSSRKTKRRE